MDKHESARVRMQCLELAVKVAGFNADGASVTGTAESYWQWMNSGHDAVKTPASNEDDIPF